MEKGARTTDSVLIVFPQEVFALQAREKFEEHRLAFESICPPEHLRDVASTAIRVSRDVLGDAHGILQREAPMYIGIVDYRQAAPRAADVDRVRIPAGQQPFLDSVQITYIAACMADETKLRFIAQFDRDISEVMPYLNAVVKGALYTPNIPSLGFPLGYRMITLYGTRLAVGKTDEIVDSWGTMARVKDLINETWARRAGIEPCTEQREKPQPLEIYKRLPRTNCRECGEPTCMAFAARLSRAEADLTQCPHMYREEYEGMRMALLSLFPSIEKEGELDPNG